MLCRAGQDRWRIFVGNSEIGDSHCIAGFKKHAWRLAVDAKDSVLDFGVRGRIGAAPQQLVPGFDVFLAAHRGCANNVFHHHHIARLIHGEIRFCRHDHAKRLHISDRLHAAAVMVHHQFAQVYCAAFWRDGPQHEREIFQAEFGGIIQAFEFGVDFDAAFLARHLSFAGGVLHEFRAVKVDFDGIAAQPVVDSLGGAMHRRRCRRGGLAQSSDAGRDQTEEQEKRQTLFHGTPHFNSFYWISSYNCM